MLSEQILNNFFNHDEDSENMEPCQPTSVSDSENSGLLFHDQTGSNKGNIDSHATGIEGRLCWRMGKGALWSERHWI